MSIQPSYLYLYLDTKWAWLNPDVGGAQTEAVHFQHEVYMVLLKKAVIFVIY